MSNSPRNAESSSMKRTKRAQALQAAFGDPLRDLRIPKAIRNLSEDLENESAAIEGQIRKLSSSSDEPIEDDPQRVQQFMTSREVFIDEFERLIRNSHTQAKMAEDTSTKEQRKELKRALSLLEDCNTILQRERATLARDRIRLRYTVQAHPRSTSLGEAYFMALTSSMEPPKDAQYREESRSSDQSLFKTTLVKAYHPDASKFLEIPNESRPDFSMLCPISGIDYLERGMKAAHIIPYAIGSENASYIFGTKRDEGWAVLWSERNGMMLHPTVEAVFDDGRMIIMPDPTDKDELISVILSQDLLRPDKICGATGKPWSEIHKKRLQFRTTTRPAKRYLYVHALITLFRRRRYNVPGWQMESEKILTGQIWVTPGKWVRRSIVRALALEYGECFDDDNEGRDAQEDFPGQRTPEEEKDIAKTVRYCFENRDQKDHDY